MDRATRTSNLLGTYLSTNQSTSVPGSSSYSTIRSGQYLDPPSYSSTRRGSNLSDDGYSRSPSRYTSTRYTGLDDDTPTSSYIPSYRRYRGDTTTDETPSYSSRLNKKRPKMNIIKFQLDTIHLRRRLRPQLSHQLIRRHAANAVSKSIECRVIWSAACPQFCPVIIQAVPGPLLATTTRRPHIVGPL